MNKSPVNNWAWKIQVGLGLTLAVSTGVLLHLLGKHLPWQLEACLTLTSALGLGVANLCIPKRVLARIGQLPLLEPNWITLWSLIFWWVGIYLIVKGHLYPGVMCTAQGGVGDVMDGKMAVAMREFGVWRSALCRRIGKWFDPLCDKLKYPPVIVLFAAALVLGMKLALWIAALEVIGTLIRNPINVGARMAWASKKKMIKNERLRGWLYAIGRRLVRKSKASGFGKIKATIQSLGLMVCAPYFLTWITEPKAMPDVIYLLALVFGALSIVSRMRIHPTFDAFIDRVGNAGSLFKHQDI
jgi:phosphatidylglycerophosphate synthase